MPRQMSRQFSIRTAPGAQLHGKAAQVGAPYTLYNAELQTAIRFVLQITTPSVTHAAVL